MAKVMLVLATEQVHNNIYNRYLRTKKRKLSKGDDASELGVIKHHVSIVLEGLRAFNSLEEDAAFFMNRPLEEIMIPNEFCDFVLPNSVRYDSSDRTHVELLQRDDVQTSLTYQAWREACDAVRSWANVDLDANKTPLSQLRVNKSLNDVFAYAITQNSTVHKSEKPFFPIDLRYINDLIDNGRWATLELSECIQNYFENWNPYR